MGKVYSMVIKYLDSKRISLLEADRTLTVVQGFDGGDGTPNVGGGSGGGGGGSSETGFDYGSSATSSDGGAGTNSSIAGSSPVCYAGGGGGGTAYAGGNGQGSCGGGNAGTSSAVGGNGARGSGGGGGGNDSYPTGGAGGTGVVIIRYATADGTANTSGSVTPDTSISGQTILTYTGTGTFAPTSSFNVQYLVIGGGGSGGNRQHGGGGGAGGFRTSTSYAVTAQSYDIEVGAGGASPVGSGNTNGGSGDSSSFGTIISLGGGRGGTYNSDGANGGSGGGSGGSSGTKVGGTGTTTSSDVTPTSVQDNSILVEKDTGRRYWFDDAFNLTGLKSYWKFNEASGDIVNQATSVGSTDSLGTGADLQITGATYNNTNTPFNTMNFDGTNDFGQAGTSLSQFNFLHNGGKWTIACWMEIIDTSVEGTIWGNTTGTNTQGVNFLQTGATTKFLVRVFDSAIWINVDMGAHGLTDGNPFFVTLTFDKDEATQKAKYFRNGSLISSGDQSTTQGTASNSPIAFRIARSSGSVYFAVNFSEYSIWNRVLSDAEITTLYNSGSGKTLDTAKGATWTMEPTFEDDFTSYADQTAADLAWVSQETASTRVNVTNDNLAFSVTGTSNKGISYDLGVGNVSDTTWILQYTLAHTTYTNGSGYGQYWIGLSSADSATLYGGAQDSISSRYNRDTVMRVEASDNSDMGNQGGTDGVDLANNTTYYVDLIRDGTSITRNIYTDSARTGTIFSTSTLTISGTITGLRYFVLRNDSASGTSGHATGTIDDIKFYNGVTTPN